MNHKTRNRTRSGESPVRNKNTGKVLVFCGKLAVSVAMLWFVFSRIDLSVISRIISKANLWWLALAWLLFATSKLVAAYRLNRFFSAVGLSLTAKLNLRLYLLGMFYNLFLPGGIGGDAYKIILLNRKSEVKLKYIFQATLLDRITGLVVLTVVTFCLLSALPINEHYICASFAAAGLTGIISRMVIQRFFPLFEKPFDQTILHSSIVQILQLFCAWCILLALGHKGDPNVFLAIFMVSSIMAVLPFTFGGAGAREFTFALAATFLSMEPSLRDTSIALGLLFYLITAITSLVGIWYLFFPSRINLS
jgi:glycosyltransferase 2 family protein